MREESENKLNKLYIIKFISEEDAIRAGADDRVNPENILRGSITMYFGSPADLSHFFYIVVEEALGKLDANGIKYKKLDIGFARFNRGNFRPLIKAIEDNFADELKEDARVQGFKEYRILYKFYGDENMKAIVLGRMAKDEAFKKYFDWAEKNPHGFMDGQVAYSELARLVMLDEPD